MKKILLGLLLIVLCGCNAVISDNSSTRSEYDLSFKDKDLDYSYSLAEAHYIELGDEDLYINNEGIYVLTGEMNDASIIVDVKDDEKVKLVLDNVTINSNDFASIYIIESDKVTITLAEDSINTLSDSSAYSQIDDNNVDAVIYSKADLVINGTGKLIVNGNVSHGIVSKDDLIITGGNLDVTSIKQGIRGKDCVKIKNSTLNITSGGDSIKSDNEDDEYRGFVYIAGGSINIDSGDDAIQAINLLQIDDGTININNSYEGLEAQYIVVNGGDIAIYSSDDGINACDKVSDSSEDNSDSFKGGFGGGRMGFGSTDCSLTINGGSIYISASGDGIDSNGEIYLYGGSLLIDGPVSDGDQAFDYETGGYAYGSETLCIGSSGMAESFSDDSTQFNLLYNLDSRYEANTKIIILIDDEVLFEHTSAKSFNSLLFTSSKIEQGDTVTITIGDDTYTYTFDQVTNSNGRGGMNQGGMPNMGDREMPKGMDKPENMPEAFDPENMGQPGDMPGGMERPDNFDPNNKPDNRK